MLLLYSSAFDSGHASSDKIQEYFLRISIYNHIPFPSAHVRGATPPSFQSLESGPDGVITI